MKQKILRLVFWMIAFAGTTFVLGFLTILAYTHIIPLPALLYLDLSLKVLFFISPLVGLLLGLRGALPGTKV